MSFLQKCYDIEQEYKNCKKCTYKTEDAHLSESHCPYTGKECIPKKGLREMMVELKKLSNKEVIESNLQLTPH